MSISLVPRAAWGARRPRNTTPLHATKPSTLHWNGPTITVDGHTSWGHDRCAGLVRGIQNFHMDGRGWSDIAYNFVVCPHGVVFEGRGLNIRSAANGTNPGNDSSHAIMCLAGGDNDFGDAEKKAICDVRDMIDRNTSAPGGLMCHSDHKSTDCPGDVRRAWVRGGQPGGTGGGGSSDQLPTLRRGSRGDFVVVLQKVLQTAGHPSLVVDGDFGPATEAAVKDLQRFFGLTADGIVGPQTWAVVKAVAG